MEWIINNFSIIVAAIGIIAAIVSIITELTKEIGFLSKIPTVLQVIVLSIVFWVVIYFAAVSIGYIVFKWYTLFAVFIVGIVTSYVCSYGWEKLTDVFSRYKKED